MAPDRQGRFLTLWASERSRIAAYALRRAASAEDAAEVVAETFTIAWQRIDEVPVGRDGRLWLYVTARNVLANDRRRQQRRSALVERIGKELSRTLLDTETLDEDRVSAQRVLASLSEPDREILMLAGWDGLDSREIGRILGCSPVAARIRLHRARTRLSELAMDLAPMPKQTSDTEHVPREATTE